MDEKEKDKANTPETKVENNTDNKEAADEKLNDQVNSGLEAIDVDIVKDYLSMKLVGKELSKTTAAEKNGVDDISEAIFKRIKKTQRVPLDITINSWIGGLMSMIQVLSPKANLPTESSEQLTKITSTVGAFDKIRDQFDDKITKAMSQFQAISSGGVVMSELETAFTSLESKVSTLKENKDALKDNAKAHNMNIKTYYQSQTRLFANEFIAQLKNPTSVTNTPKTIVDNKIDGTTAVVTGAGLNTINLQDKKITDRVEQVKNSYGTLDKKFKELNGKGNFDHKNLTLIDPKDKSIIIDPKTQTLYYLEKGVAKEIIQVGLGKGNGGDVSAVNESHSTPPGTLTVFSDKVNTMSDGRPSLLVDGLEESNKNTDKREILIHPTGVPGGKVIDKPTSLGCITMDTELWSFCKDNFAQGIMIQVMDDKFDATETAYFKQNVSGKVVDFNASIQQNVAA